MRPGPERRPTSDRGDAVAALPRIAWFRASAHADAHDDDRPVFLLIHGVGLSHRSFSRLARELVAHGTVIAPDLPGFGHAPGARRRVSIEEMAEALLPHLDGASIGRGRLVVVGHSLGAEVGIEVARLRPVLTRCLVLIGPVVDPDASTASGQARRLMIDMVLEPPLTGAMVGRDYLRGGLLSFAAGVTSMLRYDAMDRIGAVRSPLLVLRGARDPVAPAAWTARLGALGRAGRATDVPGAVHNVPHSHPREVATIIAAFAAEDRG
ncbi:alpha/beta fold hydrolase [Clavibacter michiganensis]|uniref:Acyl-CoA esterase n=1 Tax=Clavibacter michiganensis TaxID=28447 RepID=A0A251YNQ9_9MICO|nr:alpha/beta hydrolase [Clavibacter michiganensis]OUE25870.1 acyl-CoA esterase [Clavibacter michiganensis]